MLKHLVITHLLYNRIKYFFDKMSLIEKHLKSRNFSPVPSTTVQELLKNDPIGGTFLFFLLFIHNRNLRHLLLSFTK